MKRGGSLSMVDRFVNLVSLRQARGERTDKRVASAVSGDDIDGMRGEMLGRAAGRDMHGALGAQGHKDVLPSARDPLYGRRNLIDLPTGPAGQGLGLDTVDNNKIDLIDEIRVRRARGGRVQDDPGSVRAGCRGHSAVDGGGDLVLQE